MIRRLVPAFAVLVGLVGVAAGAAEPRVEPELAPDPKVVEMINGLGDNGCCLLPPIKTAGDLNEVAKSYGMQRTGPVGRDYCNKMVWAPDRRRALFCGGNHGAPHRLNDAWEYDLPSNTWVLLWAPDPSNDVNQAVIEEYEAKGQDGKVTRHKVLCTKRGGPFDPCHTWWGLTYDPNIKAMLWMNAVCFLRGEALKKLGADGKELDAGPPLWAFYPYEKKWRRIIPEGPAPGCIQGATLEYVPELKGSVWYGAEWNWSGMWLYDAGANAWKNLKPNNGATPYGHKDCAQNEAVMCWDSANQLLVAQNGKTTYHYDPATNSWTKVLAPAKDSSDAPSGSDSSSVFGYDPTGGVCLLLERSAGNLWAYSAKDRKWTKLSPQGPPPPRGRDIGYFDPERNVFVVNDGATTWLYRHKKTAK